MEKADQAASAGNDALDPSSYIRTEQRIAWLTLALGGAAAVAAAGVGRWPWAKGLAIGAVLAWLNFRWLRRGADALVLVATAQAGAKNPQVPSGTYAKIALRYVLIAFAIYVIFIFLNIPPLSMVLGLCALGAATVAASVYEILRPLK